MENALVSAGDYLIESSGRQKTIEALLLTCVGVAIYDRSAGVGGLCHILLPDADGRDTAWQPKSYASSCLALFVDDLLKQGANARGLEAVVAGGALGLPFSRHDLNLDLGGRTCECVYRFLKRHAIPVKKSEAGGCFGMKIRLNCLTWQVEIEHFAQGELFPKEIIKPSPIQIRQAIITAKPIPQITLKLIRLLRSGNYDIAGIAQEVSRDQVLSAKVISYCNSAYLNMPEKIDSIERATLLLGEIRLLEIVIVSSLQAFFESQEGGYSLLRGGLFKHSLAVASLTKIIALRKLRNDVATAYTAGLLHDIGKVVLDQYVAESRPMFYNIADERGEDLISVEKEAFATDHQEIAKELAEIWNLPENLREAVSLHHCPEKATCSPELVHAVYIADLLASWFLAGVELEKINTVNLAARLRRIGLEVADIPSIVSQAPWNEFMYL
ncbi:MAG: HDOD domain-containing protein [Deltaproteobacteria bacterium]|nr:HDOD domain-containing protein [Deltaproteobacteria bacterium]